MEPTTTPVNLDYTTVEEITRARKHIILIDHAARLTNLKNYKKSIFKLFALHVVHAKKCKVEKCDVVLNTPNSSSPLCRCEELKKLICHMSRCKNNLNCPVCSVCQLLDE